MAVIRWCVEQEDGSFMVCKEPTSSDLIEYANTKLEDKDEFDCCISDARMAEVENVKRAVSWAGIGKELNMESCIACKYWKEASGANMRKNRDGHCRRYPPALDPNYYQEAQESATEESTWYGHPIVYEEDWCGEFVEK